MAAYAIGAAVVHNAVEHWHDNDKKQDGANKDAPGPRPTLATDDLALAGSLGDYAGLGVSESFSPGSSPAKGSGGNDLVASASMSVAVESAQKDVTHAGQSESSGTANLYHQMSIKNAEGWYGWRNNSGGHLLNDKNHPMLELDIARRIAKFAAKDIPCALNLATTTARYRSLLFNDWPQLWAGLIERHEDYAESLALYCLRMCLAVELATLFVRCGVSVYAQDRWDATVLHHSARICAIRQNVDLLKFFMKKGCVVNVRDAVGRTPLIIAANYAGGSKAIDLFVRHFKGDLSLKDDAGFTPLHYAALDGHLEVVKTICSFPQANLEVTTKDGKTPLDLAKMHNRHSVAEFLEMAAAERRRQAEEEGASPDKAGEDGKSCSADLDPIGAAAAAAVDEMGGTPAKKEEYHSASSFASAGSHELEATRGQQSAFW